MGYVRVGKHPRPAGGCRADRRGLGAALDEAQIGKAAQKFLDRA
jgi:hypothetical protein